MVLLQVLRVQFVNRQPWQLPNLNMPTGQLHELVAELVWIVKTRQLQLSKCLNILAIKVKHGSPTGDLVSAHMVLHQVLQLVLPATLPLVHCADKLGSVPQLRLVP